MSQLDLLPKLTRDDSHIWKPFEPIGLAVLHPADCQADEALHASESMNTVTQQQLLPGCLESSEVGCSLQQISSGFARDAVARQESGSCML